MSVREYPTRAQRPTGSRQNSDSPQTAQPPQPEGAGQSRKKATLKIPETPMTVFRVALKRARRPPEARRKTSTFTIRRPSSRRDRARENAHTRPGRRAWLRSPRRRRQLGEEALRAADAGQRKHQHREKTKPWPGRSDPGRRDVDVLDINRPSCASRGSRRRCQAHDEIGLRHVHRTLDAGPCPPPSPTSAKPIWPIDGIRHQTVCMLPGQSPQTQRAPIDGIKNEHHDLHWPRITGKAVNFRTRIITAMAAYFGARTKNAVDRCRAPPS